jgi:hypothetical protein
MTCDDFRILVDRFTRSTRAERSALAVHFRYCSACRARVEKISAEECRVRPDVLAGAMAQGAAIAIADNLARDPEA